jgi:argininosuccinate lyase
MRTAVTEDNSTAVALANYLVEHEGVSFRQAHSVVGQLVRLSVESGKPLFEVAHTNIGKVSSKFGKRLAIEKDTAKGLLDPQRFIGSISTEGGSNPRFIAADLKVREKELLLSGRKLSGLSSSLKASKRKLKAMASGFAREVKPRIER